MFFSGLHHKQKCFHDIFLYEKRVVYVQILLKYAKIIKTKFFAGIQIQPKNDHKLANISPN